MAGRQSPIAALLGHLEAVIEEHGYAVLHVGASETASNYSYTVGLAAAGLPELLLVGIEPEVAQVLLNRVASRLRAAEKIEAGDELTEVASAPLRVLELSPTAVAYHLKAARLRCLDARALQLVWPDAQGRWPWQWEEPAEDLLVGEIPEKWRKQTP